MASTILSSAVLIDGPTATGTAGAAITQGQVVYADYADDGKLKPAISTTAAASMAVGIALNGASTNQTFRYARDGAYIQTGAVLTAADVYTVSNSVAGEVDNVLAGYATVVGIAITAGVLKVGIITSGVT